MSKPTGGQTPEDLHEAQLLEMRRAGFERLREFARSRCADDPNWLQVSSILDTIAEGYDVRAHYGIAPKPGAPPSTRGLRKWIVLHFLALSADDPNESDKVHRGTVARSWGIADGSVRKLVDEHRAELQPLVVTIGIDAIFETVRHMQPEYRRLTPNPR